ncbi:MAG: carbohydrate porin [Acetobacteraceae bacterium]
MMSASNGAMWRLRIRGAACWFAGAIGLVVAGPAWAQSGTAQQGPAAAGASSQPGFFTGLFAPSRSNLLGDMGGLRTALGNYGITVTTTDVNEVLGNATGGVKQGATYEGLTTLTVQLDTGKAFGWQGGTFNVSGLQIRGLNLSQFYLLTLQTASGIEAADTTRFWEIWYDQAFLENKFDIKLGQQSLDQEFIVSQGSSVFMNTMMGWPMVPSADLYAGGPAYPLSSLGVRLRAQPGGPITVLGGVFQDNPPGGPFNSDSQLLGSTRWGGNFNLRTGALMIAEVQYALNQPSTGDMVRPGQSQGLPGTYKLGALFDTAPFPSPRLDNTGLSLADPASNGVPLMLRNNWSVYAVMDQMVWQPDPRGPRALGVFARVMGAPGDRNLISFSVNAGVTLKAPLAGRDDDTLGVGFGVAKVSGSAAELSRDAGFFSGAFFPTRTSETFIEVTYQAQVAPWWVMQPDIQYVLTPGGGIADPNVPDRRIGNELVLGLRSTVTF